MAQLSTKEYLREQMEVLRDLSHDNNATNETIEKQIRIAKAMVSIANVEIDEKKVYAQIVCSMSSDNPNMAKNVMQQGELIQIGNE